VNKYRAEYDKIFTSAQADFATAGNSARGAAGGGLAGRRR